MPAQDTTTTTTTNLSSEQDIPLLIIGGPAGCGKSTIAKTISTAISFHFIEGDELHPPQNISKMASGIPLEDVDRWPWLDKLISTAREMEIKSTMLGLVLTCSSLKLSYRNHLRQRVDEVRAAGSRLREYFIFCKLSQRESLRRVGLRAGHYMKAEMVESQFRDLEIPDTNVEVRVFVLDVERQVKEVKRDAVELAVECVGGGHVG
jgi:gluconokinase